METELIKINEDNLSAVEKGADLIKRGELVAFPTETVYGLGADGLNSEAVKKIFIAKGRPQDNPIILHVSNIEMLDSLIIGDVSRVKPLIEKFWPGPLTIIFYRSKIVPDAITAGLDTVAIRMPDNIVARELIEKSGTPIGAPSANLSGRPSPTDAYTCFEDLNGKVPLIIDGGDTRVGVESTVLDMTSEIPTILRPGGITLEMIREVYPDAVLESKILKQGEIPKSPGQKYKHYAPKAEAFLLMGTDEEKTSSLNNFVDMNKDKKMGIMASDEFIEKLDIDGVVFEKLGSRKDMREITGSIFRALRKLDRQNVDVIVCEGFEEKGLGVAIMNRLRKSTQNRIIGEF